MRNEQLEWAEAHSAPPAWMSRQIANAIFALSFLSFIKLLPIDARVQPLGSVIGFLACMTGFVRFDRIAKIAGLFIIIIGVYVMIAITKYGWSSEIVLQGIAYVSPLMTLLGIKDRIWEVSKKVYAGLLAAYCISGLLQVFGVMGAVLHVTGLTYVMPDVPEGLMGGGRGAAFLTSEPSHGGFMICGFVAYAVAGYLRKKFSFRFTAIALSACSLCVVLNHSATVFVLLICILIPLIALVRSFKEVALVAIGAGIIAGAIWLVINVGVAGQRLDNTRVAQLYDSLQSQSIQNTDLIDFMSTFGGKRLLTTSVGYGSLPFSYFAGFGVGSYYTEFMPVSVKMGIYFQQLAALAPSERYADFFKPDAYLSSVAFDMGLPGVIAVLILLWALRPVKAGPSNINYRFARALYATAIFMVFVYSTSTMPIPWLLLAMAAAYETAIIRKRRVTSPWPR